MLKKNLVLDLLIQRTDALSKELFLITFYERTYSLKKR